MTPPLTTALTCGDIEKQRDAGMPEIMEPGSAERFPAADDGPAEAHVVAGDQLGYSNAIGLSPWHARHVPSDETPSRSFYAKLGAEGLRRRTRPRFDAAITEATAAYLGDRERVLDAGCGYGRIAIPLAARGHRVTGLDLSGSLLISAREGALSQGVRLPLVNGSMIRLPFRDSSFDAVICLWSAYYEVLDPTDQIRSLAEMWRVLAAGGLALIEGPLPPATSTALPDDRIGRDLVEGLPNPSYIHDQATLRSRCAEAGITEPEIFIRDWAGRDRMILLIRRLPADRLHRIDSGPPSKPGD